MWRPKRVVQKPTSVSIPTVGRVRRYDGVLSDSLSQVIQNGVSLNFQGWLASFLGSDSRSLALRGGYIAHSLIHNEEGFPILLSRGSPILDYVNEGKLGDHMVGVDYVGGKAKDKMENVRCIGYSLPLDFDSSEPQRDSLKNVEARNYLDVSKYQGRGKISIPLEEFGDFQLPRWLGIGDSEVEQIRDLGVSKLTLDLYKRESPTIVAPFVRQIWVGRLNDEIHMTSSAGSLEGAFGVYY